MFVVEFFTCGSVPPARYVFADFSPLPKAAASNKSKGASSDDFSCTPAQLATATKHIVHPAVYS